MPVNMSLVRDYFAHVVLKQTNSAGRRHGEVSPAAPLFYASNEPKSVPAQDLGDCSENLRNLQSVFLIGIQTT